MINKEEVMQLTEEYGGVWGIKHTERILHLISIIGEDLKYDDEVVWVSAYLHDWGGYAKWQKDGVDHALRSKEVAETYLMEKGYGQEKTLKVLQCIETHHSAEKGRSLEAQLISDADALDFLGCVGVLRMFSMRPKDLRAAYEITKKRQEQLPGKLSLEKSKEIADKRIENMNKILEWFDQETDNCF